MMQFWQYNTASNSFVGDSLNNELSENHQIIMEYFVSLFDISDKKNELSSFFPGELLQDSITIRKKNDNTIKKTLRIRKIEHQKKQSNEEESNMVDSKDAKDDLELFVDDESDLDFEYMNPALDDEYDELEDNIKDQDVI